MPEEPDLIKTDIHISLKDEMTKSESDYIEKIEFFIFNDDSLCRLDSYRKLNLLTEHIELQSSSGPKKVAVLVNSQLKDEDIINIGCYQDLQEKRVNIAAEKPEAPFMSGETSFTAGQTECIQLSVRPMLSEILIRNISCDFTGTIYQGQKIRNLKFYLCDVSSSCNCLQTESFSPSGILNYRKPRQKDMSKMSYPSLIASSWPMGEVSIEPSQVNIPLYCYPNNLPSETLGSPFTSLVIEGSIAGEKRYYRIPINRDDSGEGIDRNIRYCLDLNLKTIGSDSTDDWKYETGDNLDKATLEILPGNFISCSSAEELHISCKTYPVWMETEFCIEDLEFDRERGIYEYEIDEDGKGATFKLLKSGTGMFTVRAGEPLEDEVLVVIVVDP